MSKFIQSTSSIILVLIFFIVFFCFFFSPAVFSDRSLAIADGSVFYHPFFEEPFSLWQHDQMNGYPAYADPQYGLWYPLRWLVPTFDLFVVSAYALGASGSYFLARQYGCSIRSSVVAGFVFGLSGFMTSHLGHASIVQASAWLPLMLLAVERISHRLDPLSLAGGAVAVACSWLAGHPQISVYSVGLCVALILWNLSFKARADRLAAIRLASAFVGMVCLGLALAWIQLGPTIHFANDTIRSQLSYDDFHSFSLPSSQLPMIIFPHLFGYQGTAAPHYFGEFNYVELIPYVGMTSLIVVAATISEKGHPKRVFWSIIAVAAALYALSEETLVGELAYRTPVLNDFRAPARTALVLTVSASMLVAFSFEALAKLTKPRPKLPANVMLAALGVVGSFLVAASVYPWATEMATKKGVELQSFLQNPAVLIPIGYGTLATCLVWFTIKRLSLGVTLIALLLIAELSWTGYKAEWVLAQKLEASSDVDTATLIAEVKAMGGRVLAVSGAYNRNRALAPNSNIEFDLPMVGSYGPLLPQNFADLTGMDSTGRFQQGMLNTSLLMAVGASHIVFDQYQQTGLLFNRGCGNATTDSEVNIRLSTVIKATHLRITSNMGCSVNVAQATPVLNINAQLNGTSVSNTSIKAGIDTAEWAIKRGDVASIIQHEIPENTSVLPGTDGIGILSHSEIPLTEYSNTIKTDALNLTFVLEGGALSIQQLELVDKGSGEVTKVRLDFASQLPPNALQIVGHDNSGQTIAVFKPWLGYAWLVDNVVVLPQAEANLVIQSGTMPDGSSLNLSRTALVTSDNQFATPTLPNSSSERATLLRRANGNISLGVAVDHDRFLVISERYHKGWIGSIDGAPANVLRTNSEFMGLLVPAGKSLVTLNFHPRELVRATIVSLIALAITVLLVCARFIWRTPN